MKAKKPKKKISKIKLLKMEEVIRLQQTYSGGYYNVLGQYVEDNQERVNKQ